VETALPSCATLAQEGFASPGKDRDFRKAAGLLPRNSIKPNRKYGTIKDILRQSGDMENILRKMTAHGNKQEKICTFFFNIPCHLAGESI